jgi:hypothetical protein
MSIATKPLIAAWITVAALLGTEPCFATTIVDPSGDILSTYIGQVGPDLDILQFTAEFQGDNFFLQALLAGAPSTTALAKYTIAVDRGAGTDNFPAGFRPGSSFDAAMVFVPGTQSADVRLFVGGAVVTTTLLPPGAFTISGNIISGVVPLSMLPSTGFAPDDYTFLLWSRTQLAPGTPPQLGIADFAPDQGALSLVPEPSTWVMMLLGFGTIGFVMRRSRLPLNAADESA